MFSNLKLRHLLLILLMAPYLSSCGSKIGEDPPGDNVQEFSGTKCLSQIQPVWKAYLDGTAQDRDLERSWDCVGTALNKFKRYVRGRTSDRYTSQEIATFLEDNFLDMSKTQKVTLGLQKETMKFKQMFVGGSNEFVSRDELDKAIDLMSTLRRLSIRMNPYMKVFTLKWAISDASNLKTDMSYFEDANNEIQNTAKEIATVIENNGREYALQDFVSFVNELSIFCEEDWAFKNAISKYMPVVKKIKKTLAGGDENVIAPQEWRRFSLLGARGYVQYLRYYYFIQSVPETGSGYRLAYLARTVEDIFSVFHDLVGQKPEGMVSRSEMYDLLVTLEEVWPEFRVSPKLTLEVMKLKQLFFGGSVDSWASTDFENARLKVGRIKTMVERFLPYYLVYDLEWDPSFMSPEDAQKFFREAQFNLEATGREAGSLFEGSYSINDLQSLVDELEVLYSATDDNSVGAKIRKFAPLFIDGKNIVLGGTDASLGKDQWSPFLGFASRFYSAYLYNYYFLKNADLQSAAGLSHLSIFGNQSLNILRDMLEQKKPAQISQSELTRLLSRLVETGIFPVKVGDDAVKALSKAITSNLLLDPKVRLGRQQARTLNIDSVEYARNEFQSWLDTEMFLLGIFETKIQTAGVTTSELRTKLTKARDFDGSSEFLKIGAKELLLSTDAVVPMTLDPQGRLEISSLVNHYYSRKSLQRLNVTRMMSRILVRAYAGDLDRVKDYRGLTMSEVQAGFADLKSIFVGMGLLDPKNQTFAESRFREANIFVPHADGNALASYPEVADLIGMIWSGVETNSLLRADLVKFCLNGAGTYNDYTLVPVDCVKRAYRGSLPLAMPELPEFQKHLKKQELRDYNVFMENVLKASGYIPNRAAQAKLGDIALASHVIQYIEMIYARFDQNKDGFINSDDAVKAFPAFKGIMKELAKDQLASGSITEGDLLDLFTYILRYGQPPESKFDKVFFIFRWRGHPERWDVWANRDKIARILGYIADQVAKNQIKSEVEPRTGQGHGQNPVPNNGQAPGQIPGSNQGAGDSGNPGDVNPSSQN